MEESVFQVIERVKKAFFMEESVFQVIGRMVAALHGYVTCFLDSCT